MEELGLDQFVAVVGGELVGGAPADGVVIEHVATHSSRLRRRAAFFALPGSRSDGHDYMARAAANGAVVIVARQESLRGRELPPDTPVVAVADPLRSLQLLAQWWRQQLPSIVVAVAGSVGKTVTKDCLVEILSAEHTVYGTPGSYNSQLGVPLALLDCPRDASVAVIEVAVSDPGEMGALAEIVRPDRVIVTNVGTRWQSRFADRAHQIDELLQIAIHVPEDGWVLLGQHDPDVVAAAGKWTSSVLVSGTTAALPSFTRRKRDPEAADLIATFGPELTGIVMVRTPSDEILGDVELAVSAAVLLGIEPAAITRALENYTPTSTRMESWRSPTGVTVVRDIATPDPIAVGSALRSAKRLTQQGGRTVVVLGAKDPESDAATDAHLAEVLISEEADEVVTLADGIKASTLARLEERLPVRVFGTTSDLREYLQSRLTSGDVCLLQSPPGVGLGDVSRALVEAMAPTRLYIDMSALEENVTTIRRLVGSSVQITAMVKALAYGTDSIEVSLALQEAGVDWLGVSGADEGVALRRAGVAIPILVMMGTEEELDKMIRYRLTPVLYSERMVEAAISAAAGRSERMSVHVELDTGMHRAGLDWHPDASGSSDRGAVAGLEALAAVPNIDIDGLMTHLACADEPEQDELTSVQLARLEYVVAAARALGLQPTVHAAATAGTIRWPQAHYDMVRIGLGLFGLQPSPATAAMVELTPVLSLVSRIVHISHTPAGEGVGYNATWVSRQGPSRVGLVPAGYHDCIPRSFSNHGYVIVAGRKCPIVGRVSMDSMSIDLSDCPEASVGTEVLIYGRRGDSIVPMEDVARSIGTISYELMAKVGPRVQRISTRF